MKITNLFSMRNLSGLFVFFLTSAGLLAQPNFSGTWGLNESKSNFGNSEFRMAAVTMVITQQGNTLSVESTQPGFDGGEMKQSAKYNLDGKPSENPGFMDMVRKSVISWSADKTAMTVTTTMNFDGNEFKTSETWKLSADGKVITIDQVMPMPDGEVKLTLIYDKK
jgi:hypothetical protein